MLLAEAAHRIRRAFRNSEIMVVGTTTPRYSRAWTRELPEFDRAVSALVEDMDTRGVLNDTLLVVMGEIWPNAQDE